MIRVNDFLADFEAHHAPPSNLKISDCAARAGLWEFVRGRRIASMPCLVSTRSLASYLANGQGFAPTYRPICPIGLITVLIDSRRGFGRALVRFHSSLSRRRGGL